MSADPDGSMDDNAASSSAANSESDLDLEIGHELELCRIQAQKLENEEKRSKLEYKMKKRAREKGAKRRANVLKEDVGEENTKRAKTSEQEDAVPPATANKMNENVKEKSKRKEAEPNEKDNVMPQTMTKKGASDQPAQVVRKCRCCHYEPEDPQLAPCTHVYCKGCVDFLRAEAMRRGKVHPRCMVCDELIAPSYDSGGSKGTYRRASVEDVAENNE